MPLPKPALPDYFANKAPLEFSRQIDDLMQSYFQLKHPFSSKIRTYLAPMSVFLTVPRIDTLQKVVTMLALANTQRLTLQPESSEAKVITSMLKYLTTGIEHVIASHENLASDVECQKLLQEISQFSYSNIVPAQNRTADLKKSL